MSLPHTIHLPSDGIGAACANVIGKVHRLELAVGGAKVAIAAQVVDTSLEGMIIGTDCLSALQAIVDLRRGKLEIVVGGQEVLVPLIMR